MRHVGAEVGECWCHAEEVPSFVDLYSMREVLFSLNRVSNLTFPIFTSSLVEFFPLWDSQAPDLERERVQFCRAYPGKLHPQRSCRRKTSLLLMRQRKSFMLFAIISFSFLYHTSLASLCRPVGSIDASPILDGF